MLADVEDIRTAHDKFESDEENNETESSEDEEEDEEEEEGDEKEEDNSKKSHSRPKSETSESRRVCTMQQLNYCVCKIVSDQRRGI